MLQHDPLFQTMGGGAQAVLDGRGVGRQESGEIHATELVTWELVIAECVAIIKKKIPMQS